MSENNLILVIDDSEDDCTLYRRSLQKVADAHYEVREADDGEQGLALLEKDMPACVLLDYSLPGRNGIEVLKRVRSRYPFVPVVILTGQGNENVAVAAMQHGAQNYIAKSSITPETLEHVIRMAIEHCMLQKRIHEQRTSLEVFTRALAHDLKEPVRTIRSFADLIMQTEQFAGKTQKHFQYIQSAADRMYMLIDTVFLYTRLDDPGQIAKEICDTPGVLKETQENITQLIHERGATITTGALPKLHANRIQLTQLFQNLISNAINHSETPVTVHISAEEEGDHWLFKVKDNGPGIEESYLHKIFEPFKRMIRHEVQGAGLGLAICRKIVESHGGKIWCESTLGKGTTFLFTLPKVLPSVITQPPAEAQSIATSFPQNNQLLANILLVDDSRADIEMTRFRLIERAHLHCNLFVASNGEEALSWLHDKTRSGNPIDLVLLDINMPEMDGFEVLEKIRAMKNSQPVSVIMCTGSTYDKDMVRARSLGAFGYLTKPIEFSQLKALIHDANNIQLQQENNGYSLLRAS